ncbi:MAG: homoserine kinase [Terriglobales bacterium]
MTRSGKSRSSHPTASTRRKVRPPKALELQLPATSANLGPAFDAAALALQLFLKVRAHPARKFSIAATGRNAEVCQKLENNLILNTYREVLEAEGQSAQPLALHIENQAPIGKGCGSSASARLAGIALAVHYGGLHWTDHRIVGEASRREHHPDNAAACWMGGLAVARMSTEGQAEIAQFVPKGEWPLLLAVPEESLSTEKARGILPPLYSRADTVTNIQNSLLLLAAFTQRRPDLLSSALEDRIHQPYRASLCPLLPALQKLGKPSGILGVALSGAGPSVLIFLDARANLLQAKARVAAHLRAQRLSTELIATRISHLGAGQFSGWKER